MADGEGWRTWVGYSTYLVIVVICGIGAYAMGPTTLAAIVAFPGAFSLAAIPWQLFRDQRDHDRIEALADRNSAIALGVNSPMAMEAFRNYATFAQEYATEMANAITEIIRDGPRGSHLNLSQRLSSVRRNHALWIPSATDHELFKLEDAIWKMAVAAGFTTTITDHDQEWRTRYDMAHHAWCSLVGLSFNPLFPDTEVATKEDVTTNLQQMVLVELRRVLGTEDYSAICSLAVARALGRPNPTVATFRPTHS